MQGITFTSTEDVITYEPSWKALSWTYDNSLGRKYDDTWKEVDSVTFEISRYGVHHHTLRFKKPVTEKEAIRAAETYLSEPLTLVYYDLVKDDLFLHHNYSFEEAQRELGKYRGDMRGSLMFLERIDNNNGALTLHCGS